MRLIDSDSLRLMKVEECAGHSIEYAIGWKACIEWIKKVPTIDAIPVEWLQKMMEKTNHAFEPHFAFMYVLQEWERTKTIEELQAESEMRDWEAEQEEHRT